MAREDIYAEVRELLGDVPGWIDSMPDGLLEQNWRLITWTLGDSALTAQQKALVAFGAASAVRCPY